MNALGICMGASTISVVKLSKSAQNKQIQQAFVKPHEGSVRKTLESLLEKEELYNVNKSAVTGKNFKSLINLPHLSEPEAIELAYNHLKDKYPKVDTIVSAGGENFIVYRLDDQGRISNVHTGSKCASGTGEFFLQQLKRMGLDVEQVNQMADTENPYILSGRCSVFSKSDCTHALNKGERKERIISGLCKMMADKILELLAHFPARRVALIGGTSKNKVMVEYLRQNLPELVIPKEASYFEALGCSLWALEEGEKPVKESFFRENNNSFEGLPPLNQHKDKVHFHSIKRDEAKPLERCLIGLDVGSTTTKAVLIREKDNALLASSYLRTQGDPVGASRQCYQQILAQLVETRVRVMGLGVTGSGRQIAGLHALTEAVINEIIAHATAAVYFDDQVDTIFEIGGQDAKYTYIINQVPADYAMNEACSAGTGSFLEEAAKESLDIETQEIAAWAMKGNNPLNFNDQCSAFISSDIKNAIQAGVEVEDICAGLVYSICMNYSNRVRGTRTVGKKIFMQGGVCYNKAVPVAMAALLDKEIIVPPEPGLMGALGVALAVKEQLQSGLLEEKEFDLEELAQREVKYWEPFTCEGGREECDRTCRINLIEINGQKYPFGGSCNKYVNLLRNVDYEAEELNLVQYREKLALQDYFATTRPEEAKGRVGLNRSLLNITFLPLFSRFFAELSFEVVLPKDRDKAGIKRQAAPFCYPVELSHSYMCQLLKEELDYIFLPQVKSLYVENGADNSVICPLAQSEPYYLKAAFPEMEKLKALTAVLDFKKGYKGVENIFLALGQELGCSKKDTLKAYHQAIHVQEEFSQKLVEKGKHTLKYLEENPEQKAVVILGRPYNAFIKEANMGIPHKFASRGELVIPMDMLPLSEEEVERKMYWSTGQLIMKAARFVSRHPQLFGTYISNFSCGPDSFLINYFRDENGSKPTLTLELDSHTADAGIDTRIEAFSDVVNRYRYLYDNGYYNQEASNFRPAEIESHGDGIMVRDSKGNSYSLYDEKVHLLVPSMSDISIEAFIAALRYTGINASSCPAPGEEELKRGKAYSSCKECLPYQLTLGSLLKYLSQRKSDDEVLVFFMAEASGPCRFGQYSPSIKKMIQKLQLKNVAVLSLASENRYAGLGRDFTMRAWQAVQISDVLKDIYSSILALAEDRQKGLELFHDCNKEILAALEQKNWKEVKQTLTEVTRRLASIELVEPYHEAKKVLLLGEIYVRNDGFSTQYLVEKLADKGIITLIAPISEWIYYIDYVKQNNLAHEASTVKEKLANKIEGIYKRKGEKEVKSILAHSGLYHYKLLDISKIMAASKSLMSEELTGESGLTVGGAITEIIDEVSGVITAAPFGCMQNRIAEAILNNKLYDEKKRQATDQYTKAILDKFSTLPLLHIESDGGAFPQAVNARIDAFYLQVKRINEEIKALKDK